MSNLLKEIDLIERITIFETGSSCVEFNRCMCLDELEYTRREMANADKLHESGKKLIYYPKQKSFKTIQYMMDERDAFVQEYTNYLEELQNLIQNNI